MSGVSFPSVLLALNPQSDGVSLHSLGFGSPLTIFLTAAFSSSGKHTHTHTHTHAHYRYTHTHTHTHTHNTHTHTTHTHTHTHTTPPKRMKAIYPYWTAQFAMISGYAKWLDVRFYGLCMCVRACVR